VSVPHDLYGFIARQQFQFYHCHNVISYFVELTNTTSVAPTTMTLINVSATTGTDTTTTQDAPTSEQLTTTASQSRDQITSSRSRLTILKTSQSTAVEADTTTTEWIQSTNHLMSSQQTSTTPGIHLY